MKKILTYITVATVAASSLAVLASQQSGEANVSARTAVTTGTRAEAGVPGAATDFKVTTDIDGALRAIISAKAPLTDVDGQALGTMTVSIRRDKTEIQKLENVAAGGDISYVDLGASNGRHVYTIICSNSAGESAAAEAVAFVGLDRPAPVENIVIKDNGDGTVTITWDPVSKDVHGKNYGSTPVNYAVVDPTNENALPYANGLTACTHTETLADGADFANFGIKAFSQYGNSDTANEIVPLNTPYAFPFKESFSYATLSHPVAYLTTAGVPARWYVCHDQGLSGADSYDGDDGHIYVQFVDRDNESMLTTGKIDLTKATKPFFGFAVYNDLAVFTGEGGTVSYVNKNEFELLVRPEGEAKWTKLTSGVIDDVCDNTPNIWKFIKTDLSAYKGKVVQVGLKSICRTLYLNNFDALTVGEDAVHNLAVTGITVPERIMAGKDFDVKAVISNRGERAATDFTVNFYRADQPDEPFISMKGEELSPNMSTEVSTNMALGVGEEDAEVSFFVKVVYDGDEIEADNTSESAKVIRTYSDRPAPTELKSTVEGKDVTLSWTAAEAAAEASAVTEDCEDMGAWSYDNLGEWRVEDNDDEPIRQIGGFTFPNNQSHSHRSFFVLDTSDEMFASDPYVRAHSGDKCLVSVCPDTGWNCDDWLISPRLSGKQQEIKFYAKSYWSWSQEDFDILYTTVEDEPLTDNFVLLNSLSVGDEWQEISFYVPEGAAYFAINHTSANKFMLYLDDFTYQPYSPTLDGYNVFRNGNQINAHPVVETTYKDTPAQGEYKYCVTAIYSNGEQSAPTNTINASTVGVKGMKAGMSVKAGKGVITLSGMDGAKVAVYDTTGRAYFNSTVENALNLRVASGVYVVKAGNASVKVIVK